MKGLEAYLKKYGNHFTEELALSVTSGKWDSSRVMKKAQSMVYYNVTGSTIGDIVYLVNLAKYSDQPFSKSKHGCIKFALCIIGTYAFHDGRLFRTWSEENEDFDFTPYI